jgi:hypothetical protein
MAVLLPAHHLPIVLLINLDAPVVIVAVLIVALARALAVPLSVCQSDAAGREEYPPLGGSPFPNFMTTHP